MNKASFTIIGLGRVGTSFLRAFTAADLKVRSVYNRSKVDHNLIAEFTDTEFLQNLEKLSDNCGNHILITVSDDAIFGVTEALSELNLPFHDKTVAHSSGTYSSQILSPLKSKGAQTASFHPIKSVKKTHQSFAGVWFDMEGEAKALKNFTEIADKLEAKTLEVKPKTKPLLHAAAVFASNYLVVLADLASKTASRGDIDQEKALQALLPLMENTLQNLYEFGVHEALTGPIERGDIQTIRHHLDHLKEKPELLQFYKLFGEKAADIIKEAKPDTNLEEVYKALKDE